MIIGNLNETQEIEKLHPMLSKAFEWLRENYLTIHETTDKKRVVIVPESVYADIDIVSLKEPTEQMIELHRNYIDIHIPVDKSLTMGWKTISQLGIPTIPYDPDKDIEFYCSTPSVFTPITPGNFCIMLPCDGHAPNIGNGKVKKIVVKVKI